MRSGSLVAESARQARRGRRVKLQPTCSQSSSSPELLLFHIQPAAYKLCASLLLVPQCSCHHAHASDVSARRPLAVREATTSSPRLPCSRSTPPESMATLLVQSGQTTHPAVRLPSPCVCLILPCPRPPALESPRHRQHSELGLSSTASLLTRGLVRPMLCPKGTRPDCVHRSAVLRLTPSADQMR